VAISRTLLSIKGISRPLLAATNAREKHSNSVLRITKK
jgi:hypothetical protein